MQTLAIGSKARSHFPLHYFNLAATVRANGYQDSLYSYECQYNLVQVVMCSERTVFVASNHHSIITS